MNVEIVTVSSREPTESYYRFDVFKSSLHRFAYVPTVLGLHEEWRGLMTKPYLLREFLRRGRNSTDLLIVCDAWDIIFTQHPHGLADRYTSLYDGLVVFNGEKGMWPRGDLTEAFPDDGSPWRFLNSGFFIGKSQDILAILEAMDIETIGFDPVGGPYPNDQGEYQALFAGERHKGGEVVYAEATDSDDFKHKRRNIDKVNPGQPVPMIVDTQCHLAQTLSACDISEFDFHGPQIKNRLTGTEPGVWHLNGSAKEVFGSVIYAKYNLP